MWLAVVMFAVLVVVALAAWSDRRDRRIGVDPDQRAQAMGALQRKVRNDRAERLTARRFGRRRDDRQAGPPPWER